ncbi:hypothetical protein L3Q82_004010 [Scortum barcoo]|uniref:Uncharacterized protein n=1 Tax=Scortum barcoo TaxID=214431 RepID=A0ACB8X749_9TELE|nr:hypothetical protein L3Q82_004010 [Scortum barcoo]
MAEQKQERGVKLDQSQFCCSVCLDLLKEPVAIPCGHNYCKICIEGCWDLEEVKGKYSCPQCRETFSPRPLLRRNHMLAEVVEMLKRTSSQQASPPAVASAGPTDVACDFCCGTKPNKASMSCLTCLASYCPAHLEPHYSVPVLKKHQLVSATVPLQEKMCMKHNKLMEIYCQTDKKCICYLCIIYEHKTHCTVSAAAERAEEQKQLPVCQKKVQDRFKEREKELDELVQGLKDYKSCNQTVMQTSDEIFAELISSIKRKRTLAKQLIKAQEKTAVALAKKLQLQLQEEITKLRTRDADLEQVSHVDDHIHFIQKQERGVELDQSQFCCSVCLDLLKEPVAIPCGHNYCKICIEGCWDQKEVKRKYSCPQCRETFSPRPLLRRNHMLAEVVEMLKRTSSQQASPPAVASAGPTDVACDFCCGTKPNKASMSCLTCLASYCSAHLKPHYSVPVLKKHQLVSATVPLQEKMCMKHNKLMEIYCQTDKKCICYLCIIDEHKTHRTVSAATERAEEQSCNQTVMQTSDKIFAELISSIKRKHTLAKQLIKAQEKTAVALARKLQLQLQEEITKLRTRDADLEQVSHVDDHIHFIQTFQSLSTSCESPDLPPGPFVHPQHSFKTVTDCFSKLRDDIESLLKDTWPRISATDIVLPPVPKTREEFLRCCHPLTLDVNSVSKYLLISQEYRRVTSNYQKGYYSALVPSIRQVLCTERLSERCYWEVSWSGSTWAVAVSYNSSPHDSEFGKNHESWSLLCSEKGYSFHHNTENITVSGPRTNRIGVFLDYYAGTLSFYSISGTSMTLLHQVHTSFTQPLYPGLGLKDDEYQSSKGKYAEITKLW